MPSRVSPNASTDSAPRIDAVNDIVGLKWISTSSANCPRRPQSAISATRDSFAPNWTVLLVTAKYASQRSWSHGAGERSIASRCSFGTPRGTGNAGWKPPALSTKSGSSPPRLSTRTSPSSGMPAIREPVREAIRKALGSAVSYWPAKVAFSSMTGTAGSGTITRRMPRTDSRTGSGSSATTAADRSTIRPPQEIRNIGPTTSRPGTVGNSGARRGITRSAASTGSGGKSSSPAVPSAMQASRVSRSTALLTPTTPPMPLTAKPSPI